MRNALLLFAAGMAGQLICNVSFAHAGAGDREFPATILTDDPAVKDEMSLPAVVYLRNKGSAGSGQNDETDTNFELDRRLTENLGIAVSTGYTWLRQSDGTRLSGTQQINTTLKYQYVVNPEHEFVSSIGITRIWGNSGSKAIADRYGSTEPTFYFGKGLGDLPVGVLRALAITGTVGLNLPDRGATDKRTLDFGFAIEYSIPYLQDQVQDYGLPVWLSRLVPVIEITNSRPADGSSQPATGTIAPGLIYSAKNWQLGAEILLPGTSHTRTDKGVQLQLHFFLDRLSPGVFGKPVFGP